MTDSDLSSLHEDELIDRLVDLVELQDGAKTTWEFLALMSRADPLEEEIERRGMDPRQCVNEARSNTMTFVIRFNAAAREMKLFESIEKAGTSMPLFKSAMELATGNAPMSVMAKFYNSLTGDEVKKFADKNVAARRIWAACKKVEFVKENPAPGEDPVEVSPEEPKKEAPAAAKRGRKPGSSRYSGKRIFGLKPTNPRRPGTHGFKSYEIIRGQLEGVFYEDYILRGGRPNDLQWDIDRKWAEVKS